MINNQQIIDTRLSRAILQPRKYNPRFTRRRILNDQREVRFIIEFVY
jgi:hypothetical protein